VAQAALDRARLDQKNAIIRSPVDGVVIARNVELGQGVVSSFQASNLFSIAEDLHKMQVLANIDEADIGFVKVGSVADFTVDAFRGQHHKARVEQIRNAPQTAQSVVTYVVVLSVENPDLTLRPGMTANVRLEVARRQNALLLPSAALRFKPRVDDQSTADARRPDPAEPDKRGPASERRKGRPAAADGAAVPARSDEPATPGLAYLPGEGRAMAQRIVVGITDGTLVEIREGLSEGQQVIVDVVRSSGSATSGRPSSSGGGGGGGGMRRGGM
jgi:HlyD family secretion protein